jgi:hypothetical protein
MSTHNNKMIMIQKLFQNIVITNKHKEERRRERKKRRRNRDRGNKNLKRTIAK